MRKHYTPKDYAENVLFDGPEDSPLPERKYIILSTERSGSNFLCHNLSSLGAGIPIEYFNPPRKHEICKRWYLNDNEEAYLQKLFRQRSRNSIFGLKLMAHQLAQRLPLIHTHFPIYRTRIVLLLRADIAHQAVSLHRAIRSGQWWRHTDEIISQPQEHITKDDPTHIDFCFRHLLKEEIYLRKFLFNSSYKSICMFYENFKEDLESSILRILDFIDSPALFDSSKLTPFIQSSVKDENI